MHYCTNAALLPATRGCFNGSTFRCLPRRTRMPESTTHPSGCSSSKEASMKHRFAGHPHFNLARMYALVALLVPLLAACGGPTTPPVTGNATAATKVAGTTNTSQTTGAGIAATATTADGGSGSAATTATT